MTGEDSTRSTTTPEADAELLIFSTRLDEPRDRAAARLLARVSAPQAFGGFRRAAFEWFEALERDNSKRFFEAHRDAYETDVRGPLEIMLEELTNEFDGRVKMFRQNRDIRFSKDKSPYKTATYGLIRDRPGSDAALYAQLDLRRPVRRQRLLPAEPGPAGVLSRARRGRAGANLERMLDELSAGGFTLMGEELKTVPRGYPRDHPRAAVLRRRSVAGGRRLRRPRGAGSRASGRWPTCATPGAPSRRSTPGSTATSAPPKSTRAGERPAAQRAPRRRGARPGRPSRTSPTASSTTRAWPRGTEARARAASRVDAPRPAGAGGRGGLRPVVVARPLDRRAGRLRRAQPRRGRG